ncbi:CaiB/BaiF CoA transferase family protein [Variovorax sp. RA8]|uniref:CaiB/BaiF CoA transferase family protein n=1 Tax=Variovorax sp. (strain JCM 16519 / RA8) TaxID=662548 RepID=UPI00131955AD|nr:CaiB/BaiF CoA-transferase family protein [Variovorax sp. RA8]VTU41976.1 Succinyl-CoA:(R)-benzylsuccinate CoA-transferase subunit BbsF [Variovorax sp. RA8]
MHEKALPLEGICVVEIGHSLAAPYAGLIFAHLGARVVKIENASGGDYARGWGPPFIDGASALFHAINHGKESISADFNDSECIDRIREFIVANAHVVIQNLKPGNLERHRLGAQDLTQLSPSLIYCNMGAFGATGPLRDKPGYDPLVQAYSGMMSIVGHDADAPSRVPVSINDMGTGMWAVIGVLAALRGPGRAAPRGRIIDVSLYETALAWMTVPLSDCLAGGKQPARMGSGSPNIVPYQVFDCSDEAILVAAGNDTLYRRLCTTMDLPELAHDTRFATNGARVSNREELILLLGARFGEHPAGHWLSLLEAESIPCGPLQPVDRVVANEQTAALDILRKTPDGRTTTVALPISFDRRRPPLPGNTPELGQHNQLLGALHSTPVLEKR